MGLSLSGFAEKQKKGERAKGINKPLWREEKINFFKVSKHLQKHVRTLGSRWRCLMWVFWGLKRLENEHHEEFHYKNALTTI